MSISNTRFGTAMTANEYADEWAKSASSFAKSGDYRWMAEMAGAGLAVLEIGCGTGESTISLGRRGKRVLAVESNQRAIELCLANLSSNGIEAELVDPAQIKGWLADDGKAVGVVNGNIFDQELQSAIPEKSFDAVACWNVGSDPATIGAHLHISVSDLTGEHIASYREVLHRECYRFGAQILAESGIVHIIDRIGIPSWQEKSHYRSEGARFHRSLSAPLYKIDDENVILRRLNNQLGASSIRYVTPTATQLQALISVQATLIKHEIISEAEG